MKHTGALSVRSGCLRYLLNYIGMKPYGSDKPDNIRLRYLLNYIGMESVDYANIHKWRI